MLISAQELAALLDPGVHEVAIPKKKRKCKIWTAEEKEILMRPGLPIAEIAKLLPDRKYHAIATKRGELRRAAGLPALKAKYTKEEKRLARETKHLSIKAAIKFFPGRTQNALASLRRCKLGIRRFKLWKKKEIEFLMANFDSMPKEELAAVLNRSLSAVYNKHKDMLRNERF